MTLDSLTDSNKSTISGVLRKLTVARIQQLLAFKRFGIGNPKRIDTPPMSGHWWDLEWREGPARLAKG